MSRSFERLPAVVARVGLSRSQLYKLVSAGEFPAPVQIGPRAVAWLSADVDNWIDERVARSRDRPRVPSRGDATV